MLRLWLWLAPLSMLALVAVGLFVVQWRLLKRVSGPDTADEGGQQ